MPAPNTTSVAIQISADATKVVQASKQAQAAIDELAKHAVEASAKVESVQKRIRPEGIKVASPEGMARLDAMAAKWRAAAEAREQMARVSEASGVAEVASLGRTAMAAAAVSAAIGTIKLVIAGLNAAERMAELEHGLMGVTRSAEEAAEKVRELAVAARQVNAPMADMVEGYAKLRVSMESAGFTSKETLDTLKSLQLAMRLGGVGAAQAQSTMLQFSQMLSYGKVRAQEFNIMMMSTPTVMKAAAEAIYGGTNALAKLREAARNETLTPEDLVGGLIKALDTLQGKIDDIGPTLQQMRQQASDSLTRMGAGFVKTFGLDTLQKWMRQGLNIYLDQMVMVLDVSEQVEDGIKQQIELTEQLTTARMKAAKLEEESRASEWKAYRATRDHKIDIEKEVQQVTIQNYQAGLAAVKANLSEAMQQWERYRQKAKDVAFELAEALRSVESQRNELDYKDMKARGASDKQIDYAKYVDATNLASKAFLQAQKAQEAFAKGDVTAAEKYIDAAKAFVKEEQAMAGQLESTYRARILLSEVARMLETIAKVEGEGYAKNQEDANAKIGTLQKTVETYEELILKLQAKLKHLTDTKWIIDVGLEQQKMAETEMRLASIQNMIDRLASGATIPITMSDVMWDVNGNPVPLIPDQKASGGLLRGPGTGTSDSILMRGSTGEYMVNAWATRSVGVAAMEYINRHGRLPRYAQGGAVGAGTSGVPIYINLGPRSIGPMVASQSVAADLTSAMSLEIAKRGTR